MKPLLLAATLIATPAMAHTFWDNGEPVPSWVREACCGPRDVHHLKPGTVHIMADGVHIDGINTIVPIDRALPSPDGTAWAFWSPTLEPDPIIFCLFIPFNGV